MHLQLHDIAGAKGQACTCGGRAAGSLVSRDSDVMNEVISHLLRHCHERLLEAMPSEDAVAGGGLAARLARRISAAPSRHVVRLNMDMFQRRIESELQLWLDGESGTRKRIWRWELWILPAEDSFGIIPFHGGIFTSLSFLQSLFSPAEP